MDLEQQQPALYHRYNVDEGDEEEEDEEGGGGGVQGGNNTAWGAEMITEAILGMEITDHSSPGDDDGDDEGEGQRQTLGSSPGEGGHDYGESALWALCAGTGSERNAACTAC